MGFQHKIIALACVFAAFAASARAEQREVTVEEASSTGRTIVFSAGSNAGLQLREAVLLRSGEEKVLAARIVKVFPERSVAYIVERYRKEVPGTGETYQLLWGDPGAEIVRPADLSDIDSTPENPLNERFLEAEEKRREPDLDDESYNPEVILSPKMPGPRTTTANNLTVGVGVFRNADLSQIYSAERADGTATTTYQGYALRYQYNWRTHFWLFSRKMPTLISAEAGVGIYRFGQNFVVNGLDRGAEIQVMPISFNFKYNFEIGSMLRLYPYIGFQNRIVSATAQEVNNLLDPLRGGKIMAGGGVAIVMSENLDARFDIGIDGYLFGVVAKF